MKGDGEKESGRAGLGTLTCDDVGPEVTSGLAAHTSVCPGGGQGAGLWGAGCTAPDPDKALRLNWGNAKISEKEREEKILGARWGGKKHKTREGDSNKPGETHTDTARKDRAQLLVNTFFKPQLEVLSYKSSIMLRPTLTSSEQSLSLIAWPATDYLQLFTSHFKGCWWMDIHPFRLSWSPIQHPVQTNTSSPVIPSLSQLWLPYFCMIFRSTI